MNYNFIKNYFKILENQKQNKKLFCILENKKTGRSIIFERNNKKAIGFMKNKFSSFKKRIAYLLIKLKILCLFKRKIALDSNIGQLIYFGGQTKIFNFNKNIVTSFIRISAKEKNFIKSKREQKELAKKGFAPKIIKLNKKIPFCVEELLKEGSNISEKNIFQRCIQYYGSQKKKKIPYSSYIKKLEKERDFSKLPIKLKEEISKIKKQKGFFYILKIHGDFEKNQILLRNNEILFTDWQIREDLILFDLLNFYRKEKNILKSEKFQDILGLYPKEVIKDFEKYLTVFKAKLFLSKNK